MNNATTLLDTYLTAIVDRSILIDQDAIAAAEAAHAESLATASAEVESAPAGLAKIRAIQNLAAVQAANPAAELADADSAFMRLEREVLSVETDIRALGFDFDSLTSVGVDARIAKRLAARRVGSRSTGTGERRARTARADVVAYVLSQTEPFTKADITDHFGGAQSVAQVVGEMVKSGEIVADGFVNTGKRGKPPVSFIVAPVKVAKPKTAKKVKPVADLGSDAVVADIVADEVVTVD